MDNDKAVDSLLVFISDNYMVDKDEIPLEISLIDEGVIDSFGLIEIASFLEKEFNIVVEEDELVRENFGSVIKIINYVSNKKSSK